MPYEYEYPVPLIYGHGSTLMPHEDIKSEIRITNPIGFEIGRAVKRESR